MTERESKRLPYSYPGPEALAVPGNKAKSSNISTSMYPTCSLFNRNVSIVKINVGASMGALRGA
jgi:hypothetical protein